MDDWDVSPHPARRRRPVAVAALVALAVVGGMLARGGALDGTGGAPGALDVDPGFPDDGAPDGAIDDPHAPDGPVTGDGSAPDGGDLRDDPGADAPELADPLDGKAQELVEDADGEDEGAGTAAGVWEPLPDAPLAARAGHTLAWSGDELLVWGGGAHDDGSRGEFFADGAAYDPRGGNWRTLPPAPLERRSGAGAAWTGDELLVWGGVGATAHFADGAAYDPEADAWRAIAASPLSPRQGPATVWTGEELLVLGGSDFAGALRDAAAYAPAEDAWRPVADLPAVFSSAWNLDGAWTGEAAVVWAEYADDDAPGAWYEPSSDRWELLPPVSRRGPVSAAWTGEELLALRGSGLVAWRPGEAEWQPREAPWGSSDPWFSRAHWTGEDLVVVRGAERPRVDVYDPGTDTWDEGPLAPEGVGEGPGVWNGTALLTWGGSEYAYPGHDARGAAYRPGGER